MMEFAIFFNYFFDLELFKVKLPSTKSTMNKLFYWHVIFPRKIAVSLLSRENTIDLL